MSLLLAGCGGGASHVVLGAAGPWTQGYGLMNRRGIQLALDELNARPGRHTSYSIVWQDDDGKGEKASAIARGFVESDSIVAVVGHVSSGAMVAAARVYDGHLPAVATTATSPALTGISPWAFRVISSDSVNGMTVARFATRRGFRRAAILYENTAYGRGLADAFRHNFKGQIVGWDPIDEGDTQDFEPVLDSYERVRPDVIFVAGTDASGGAFLVEARARHIEAALIGGDGWMGLAADTARAEGVWVGAPFSAEDQRPEAQRFVAAFREKYGLTPDGNAALGYDATMVVARAVEHAGADRAKIRRYLATMTDADAYDGVTGKIRFQPDGDPVGKSIVMTRITHGALQVEDAR